MKVLFITPPFSLRSLRFLNRQYPLNLMMMASFLRSRGIEVRILDFDVVTFTDEELKSRLEAYRPDIVGFTALTPCIKSAGFIAQKVKDYDRRIKTVIGGVHASALPERTLKEFPAFDLLVLGEGEITLFELIKAFAEEDALSNIKGLSYRKNGKIIVNTERCLIEDIDTLPFPARDLVSRELYMGAAMRGFLSKKEEVDYVLTSRGCMGRCIFCAANVVHRGNVRLRSAESVIEEARECKEKYNTERIVIMDDTFVISGERLLDICKGLKSLGIRWNCSSRVDFADEEKIRVMAESGCECIQFGIESGSQRMLDLMKKGTTLEQIKNAFKWAHKYGITTDSTLMLGGHPSETMADIKMSEALVREVRPSFFSCAVSIPYPGTESNKIMKDKGYITYEDWDEYVLLGEFPNYRTDYFTYKELRKIQRKLLIGFYMRPLFIIRKLFSIRSMIELKYWFRIGIDFIKSFVMK